MESNFSENQIKDKVFKDQTSHFNFMDNNRDYQAFDPSNYLET